MEAARMAGSEREAFFAGLDRLKVKPLWNQYGELLPKEPKATGVPCIWRWRELREVLAKAGEVVSAKEAERRALMLMNPGLGGAAAATRNLYAALQLILPGEVARAHRHAACALRFVVEGSGAYTTVEGEKTEMQPGDLVLTPSFTWHDHGNDSGRPMVWLDGLDLPIVNALGVGFYERGKEERQPLVRPADASARLYASARLNPAWQRWEKPFSPVVNYPWKNTEAALRALAQDTDGAPEQGILMQYTNPFTGGPVMPTIACFVRWLKPGMKTVPYRQTPGSVVHVVRGSGVSKVAGERIDWEEHDTFAVPGWAVHTFENPGPGEAILFSYSDEPVLRALGFYREERL